MGLLIDPRILLIKRRTTIPEMGVGSSDPKQQTSLRDVDIVYSCTRV